MEEKLVREMLNDLASQPRGLKVSDANSGNLTEATT
jgi:hypothetical protein